MPTVLFGSFCGNVTAGRQRDGSQALVAAPLAVLLGQSANAVTERQYCQRPRASVAGLPANVVTVR